MRTTRSALKCASTPFNTVVKTLLIAMFFVCAFERPAHASPFAYVTGDGPGTITAIDLETNTVVATISLPIGESAESVAVAPDGASVYVTTGFNSVVVIDTSTNTISAPPISVGSGPRGIAISPDGNFAYVANQFSSSVSVIDTASNTVIATIQVGSEPTGIGVTGDGSTVYVADSVFGAVWIIDAGTNTLIGSVTVGPNPQALIVSHDSTKVYVSNFNAQSVSVIDTASNTVQATIAVGFFPLGMDTSPDDSILYVVDGDPVLNNGSVAVIDTTTNTLSSRVTLPPFHVSRYVAITADGALGYVTINNPQQVLVFDTATNTVLGDPIVVDGIPEAIAITPSPPSSAGLVPRSIPD